MWFYCQLLIVLFHYDLTRYCGKLTSGFGSMNALPPRWTLNTMCENSIDDTEWLADLKTALNKLISQTDRINAIMFRFESILWVYYSKLDV